jgi:hypothetical protein
MLAVAVGFESHIVTVFAVTTGGSIWIPVCQLAGIAALSEQVAVSVAVAPVIVIVGCACEVSVAIAVPFVVAVPLPIVLVTDFAVSAL